MRFMPSPEQLRRMDTAELRRTFLVQDLFAPGEVRLVPIDLDRVVLGGAVPTTTPLPLEAPAALAASHFTERRELGVLNIGGAGTVRVAGEEFALGYCDMVYIGRGSRDISFASRRPDEPARFYLVSYPAHAAHPTVRIGADEAESAELGSVERANRRRLARYIHAGGAPSAQLVMGVTAMETGSVWNTMPPHTHQRRTEVYLYFGLPGDGIVCHFLGEPDETRSLIVRDGEVALSPGWSIHAGCGTASYRFCWAMGGENQEFADMQGVDVATLR